MVASDDPLAGLDGRSRWTSSPTASGCSTTRTTVSPGSSSDVCRRAGFRPRGTVRTSQAEGAVRLAAAGLGLALVPDNIVAAGDRLQPCSASSRGSIRDVAVYARTRVVADRGGVRGRAALEPAAAADGCRVDRPLRRSYHGLDAPHDLLATRCGPRSQAVAASSPKATSTQRTTDRRCAELCDGARPRRTARRHRSLQAADRGGRGRQRMSAEENGDRVASPAAARTSTS